MIIHFQKLQNIAAKLEFSGEVEKAARVRKLRRLILRWDYEYPPIRNIMKFDAFLHVYSFYHRRKDVGRIRRLRKLLALLYI